MLAAAYYHSPELPWTVPEDEERRYRKILKRALLFFLLLALLMPFLPVPEITRERIEEIPPRLAKLILERQQPPAPSPAPPQPELKKLEPKPAEAKKVQPTKKIEAARAKAERSGLLAFKDELADLRTNSVSAKLEKNPANNAAAQGAGPTSNRSVITAGAAKGSGGIQTAALSKDTGGGGLGTRGTTQVSSPVGVGDGGGTVRRGSGGRASRAVEEIRIVLDRNKGAIYTIYNRALREDPGLEGKFVFVLTIAPSGRVTNVKVVSSELRAAELERKLVARLKLIEFGAKEVDAMEATYWYDFTPS